MKLISVKYLNESETAVFFNITFEKKYLFKKAKIQERTAFFKKPPTSLGMRYVMDFYWLDNNESNSCMSYENFIQEMILQYEKYKK